MNESILKDTGTELKNPTITKNNDIDALYSPFPYDEKKSFLYDLKLNYRLLRKSIRKYIDNRTNKNFTNIVYLTADCPFYMPKVDRLDSPVNYIDEMRKQYPDTNICLMFPIIGLSRETKISKKMSVDIEDKFFSMEKTSVSFDIFAQNSEIECSLYRFAKNETNINVYGIFSPDFSYINDPAELKTFEKLSILMRAARTAIKNLYKEGFKPDIVHSESLPFFLGSEFEQKFPTNIKVFQVFDNFSKETLQPQEPFRSVINLADKEGIKKLCSDTYIQNCFAKLFNISLKIINSKMQDYISLVRDNYKMFYDSDPGDYTSKGILIFKHLNARTKKLFPNLIRKEDNKYYPLSRTFDCCDYWAVYSKTYYRELLEKKLAEPKIMKDIMRNSSKSGYILPTIDTENYDYRFGMGIYNDFDENNYRELKIKNKKMLIKEFCSDFLKTNFVDSTLFKNPNDVKIYGYLDSFYDAPLLFANPENNVYTEGVDILLSTLLKLFERNRNIQVILSIKDGLKQDYIKSVIEFLQSNNIFMGRWVYIDDEVNLQKIFSAADICLYPARLCDKSIKHLLGLRYGCIPVVSNTGILNDTIFDIYDNLSEGNGFKTRQSLLYEDENTNIYINYLEKALDLYNNNRSSWNRIIKNSLNTNTGWDFSKLEHYDKIYNELL